MIKKLFKWATATVVAFGITASAIAVEYSVLQDVGAKKAKDLYVAGQPEAVVSGQFTLTVILKYTAQAFKDAYAYQDMDQRVIFATPADIHVVVLDDAIRAKLARTVLNDAADASMTDTLIQTPIIAVQTDSVVVTYADTDVSLVRNCSFAATVAAFMGQSDFTITKTEWGGTTGIFLEHGHHAGESTFTS
ncbi:MAG: hypothetical protein NUV53_03965 [Patescibacteria group bacterium]|nr:hypothetical protein [Patescibacteria group bacterium]